MKSAKWENIFKGWNRKESNEILTLKQVPVFKDFQYSDFRELENLMHKREYKAGDYIFKNRAPGEGMYIIVKGNVKITVGTRSKKENVFANLTDGEFFGELALFDDEPRSANAIATENTQLLGFFTQDLMTLQERNPVLGQKILFNLGGLLGERLRKTNALLVKGANKKMSDQKNYIQLIYRIIIGLILVWFLSTIWPYISNVILMLVFAFLFTTILLSSVDNLERKINNRGVSVLLVVILLLGSIGGFLGSFISQISKQAIDFSKRVDKETLTIEFANLVEKFTSSLPNFLKTGQSSNEDFASKLAEFTQTVLGSLASMAGAVGNFMFLATMIFIFTIILLAEYHVFRKSLVSMIPNKYFEIGLKLIFNIEKSVSSYLKGQFLSASSVAAMSIAGLIILNLAGANLTLIIFIGIIAGLSNLIPLIGPFVGMVPAILISFMNNIGNDASTAHMLFGVLPSPFFIFDIILMFLVVQQIEGNLITPTLVGKSVGLHPMLVMISLLIGGTLLGPLGMLFAVPASGIIKVIVKEVAFVRQNAQYL